MGSIYEHAEEMTQTLGSRMHSMRESRDWTLDELAERTDLSKAYLSRLEGGDRQPSFAALCAIAKAFQVSVAALFEHPDQSSDCIVVRGGSAAKRSVNGLTYVSLSGSTKPFNLQPIEVTVPADRKGDETYQHVGEEWLHVTGGRIRLSLDGRVYLLETGDSAHFDSRLAHRLDALDDKDATIILVASPIPIALNPRREVAEPATGQFG
jgi:quercetin dioxygenase-like cupin family protein/DNA-binding XRE family transcriptional regulator